MHRVLVLLALGACAAGCSGNGKVPPGPDGSVVCTNDGDCPTGQTCQQGACAAPTGCAATGCSLHALCDAASGQCVRTGEKPCIDATDCGEWRCNAASGRCLEPCIVDTDCDLGQVCNNDQDVLGCVDCTFDPHCRSPERPFCLTVAGRCVACTREGHCDEGEHCDLTSGNPETLNSCLPGCKSAADCGGRRCVELGGAGQCVSCTVDTQGQDCTDPNTPFCHPQTFECVQCVVDGGCPGGFVCSDTGQCVECKDDAHCTMGFVCNTATNACIPGCRDDTKCPPPNALPRTRCDPSRGQLGECVVCLEDTECALGEKCSGGDCVDGCDDDANCPTDRPRCNTVQDRCVECMADGDCNGLICNTTDPDPMNRFTCRCRDLGESCATSDECGNPPFDGICVGVVWCGAGVSCADNGSFSPITGTCIAPCNAVNRQDICPAGFWCERVQNGAGSRGLKCLPRSVCGR